MHIPVTQVTAWSDVQALYQDLETRSLNQQTVHDWLADWSRLAAVIDETARCLEVETTRNTADIDVQQRYHSFLDEVFSRSQEAEQQLKERLLASGLDPEGFAVQIRKMRIDAALYREANVPVQIEEKKLVEQYDGIVGSFTARWNNEDVPLSRVRPALEDQDRAVREQAWRAMAGPPLAHREAINDLWRRELDVRTRLASNAGLADYRAFRWQELRRFDYTPDDCLEFHRAVLDVTVPVVKTMHEERRRRLGVEALRPWDVYVDPLGRPALQPFHTLEELVGKTAAIFHHVDPQLGAYFETMVREDLLDLESRKNKAPGGYCLPFNVARLPFIFLSLVGTQHDIQGLLHEGGHAFHVFEAAHLPYVWQRDIETVGAEFAEVGSTAMELLAAPYLSKAFGGFYDEADVARARVQDLQSYIRGWSHIAIIDAFQHWVYEQPTVAVDPSACDAQYFALLQRYLPGIDWTGLEEEGANGWQQVPHIHQTPFYYIEYGLAQLGAAQIWAAALKDQEGAVARYRRALALGDTRSIAELFNAAGAELSFSAASLRPIVDLMVRTIGELEGNSAA